MDEKKLIGDLKALVGKDCASDSIYERITYGQDSSQPDLPEEKIPLAVVKPKTAQGVAEFIKYANKNKIPIYIHGAGTAFKGSPKPKRTGSILLSTQGLTQIEAHEEDMYYELGAGVNLWDLEKLLLRRGYMLPMTMGSKFSATIGGAVAVNTVGHMVDICIGKLIDYVMGVEVVLPNGEIIETGTKSIRRPAGLDYTRFFAGSEGLFGVITRVRFRILPARQKAYVVGFFPTLQDVAHAFQRYYREKLPPPLYGEVLDRVAARAPFKLRGLGEPQGDMALVMNVSYTQEEADRQARETVRVFQTENAIKAWVVTSKHEQEAYWESRDNILNILQASDGNEQLVMAGAVEASVPLSRLAEALEYMQNGHSYAALKASKMFIYGHIGTCDIHGMWVATTNTPKEKIAVITKEATLLERDINLRWGCASGEIGQTASRMPFFKKRYGEAAHAMLLGVKRAIDPNNILNPGNLEGEGYE